MQKLEISDIKDLKVKEIDMKLNSLRTSLFNYKMQIATSGLKQTHYIKIAKKNIARLLTVKNLKKGEE